MLPELPSRLTPAAETSPPRASSAYAEFDPSARGSWRAWRPSLSPCVPALPQQPAMPSRPTPAAGTAPKHASSAEWLTRHRAAPASVLCRQSGCCILLRPVSFLQTGRAADGRRNDVVVIASPSFVPSGGFGRRGRSRPPSRWRCGWLVAGSLPDPVGCRLCAVAVASTRSHQAGRPGPENNTCTAKLRAW